jgi:hypothetical protein
VSEILARRHFVNLPFSQPLKRRPNFLDPT